MHSDAKYWKYLFSMKKCSFSARDAVLMQECDLYVENADFCDKNMKIMMRAWNMYKMQFSRCKIPTSCEKWWFFTYNSRDDDNSSNKYVKMRKA